MAACLREAAPAKAGNAAGGFFQHSLYPKNSSWITKICPTSSRT
jgi:hypothetical protein